MVLVASVMLLCAAGVALAKRPAAGPGPLAGLHDRREVHLRNVRQLTTSGENAEAYFSFDGRKLVFQSRPDNQQADQIYVMGTDGQGRRRISTGAGRTTCGYFLPGDQEVIFASTHGYGPEVPAPPDRSQGYVWPI